MAAVVGVVAVVATAVAGEVVEGHAAAAGPATLRCMAKHVPHGCRFHSYAI